MTKGDKIVIGVILIFALLFFVVFNCILFADTPDKAVISVDGGDYASYRLSEVNAPKTVKIETEFGTNTIEITNRGARVIEASCPDKLDVHAGEITKKGQMIVCVPNRLTVKLEGNNSEVDGVAH